MKKFIFLMLTVITSAMVFTSCKETQGFVWNVQAQAAGEGKITVTYPTGNPGLVVEGKAVATATTTNDTTVNTFTVPNGGLLATDVLANPAKYTKQQVADAQLLVNEAANSAVEFKAEGEWAASVTGYAKYGQMYFVIDEHWPTDTTKVVALPVVEVAEDTVIVK